MSKETLEHLSSLMDGETTQETGMFLTRRVCADEELGRTWNRYHLIRDCMRRSEESWSVSRITMNIEQMLEQDSDREATQVASAPAWIRPLSGLAIAASVAMTAILLVAPDETGSPAPALEPFASPNTMNLVPASQAASFGNPNAGRVSNTMSDYLARHKQVAGAVQGPTAATGAAASEEENPDGMENGAAGQQP